MRRVLLEEAEALRILAERLDPTWAEVPQWILELEGRVVTCGVGKSGHIARKAAGTLASTGTPSFFVHAAEALHGDLGMVTAADLVLLLTYSGESDEMIRLLPALKAIGCRTVAITGRPESSVGRGVDRVLDVRILREACPNDLAPTTSTTAMLALCDALAVAVMEARGFTREDFARLHPSGTLGRRLLLRVADVMRTGDDCPVVAPEAPVLEVMRAITKAGAGAACVVDETERVIGFISDGDLRRHFVHHPETCLSATARDLMNSSFSKITGDILAVDALETFQNFPKKIGELPVVDDEGRLLGLLVLKDLLRCGIV